MTPMRELHERVARMLGALAPGVAVAQGTVAELVASLCAMEETLTAIRRLKTELARER
jgi:hypothetical protein